MLNKLLPTFYAGTAVRITSVFNIATPTTARITIKNPSFVQVAANVDMVKDADSVYSYVMQSATSWPEGDYVVTVDVSYAGYQSVTQQKFTLVRQE
jgi:hypothetical protein